MFWSFGDKRENFWVLLRLYKESGRGDAVREAILAAFPDTNGPFDTDKCKADLLRIIIQNQMGMSTSFWVIRLINLILFHAPGIDSVVSLN